MSETVQSKRTASSIGSASWIGLPKPPRMPDRMLERFPELADWQEQQDRWWENFVGALQLKLMGPAE